jgi:hypothetical protein
MTNTSISGSISVGAYLVDCDVVKKRKAELQLSSPADLVRILGPSAFDESRAATPLKESSISHSANEEKTTPHPPDRPRKRTYPDREKPFDSPEDEAIAQYLAMPKSIREFKSVAALAKHFSISRQTVYRRRKDLDVLQRVEWLVMNYRLAGDLIARRNWPQIVASQVKAALAGDTRAAQFCKVVAWPETSGVSASLSIGDASAATQDTEVIPSHRLAQFQAALSSEMSGDKTGA